MNAAVKNQFLRRILLFGIAIVILTSFIGLYRRWVAIPTIAGQPFSTKRVTSFERRELPLEQTTSLPPSSSSVELPHLETAAFNASLHTNASAPAASFEVNETFTSHDTQRNAPSPPVEKSAGWILVPSGKFHTSRSEASPTEITEVTINYDFYIAQEEIKVGEFKALMPNIRLGPFIRELAENAAVTHVSWDDAMGYCQELSKFMDVPAGYVCRLPTEAEWEYVCRLSSDTPPDLRKHTIERSQAAPAHISIHGLHEHPAEWCLDVLPPFPTSSTNPLGRIDGPSRSLRGTHRPDGTTDCVSRHVAHGVRGIRYAGFRPVIAPEVAKLSSAQKP